MTTHYSLCSQIHKLLILQSQPSLITVRKNYLILIKNLCFKDVGGCQMLKDLYKLNRTLADAIKDRMVLNKSKELCISLINISKNTNWIK